MIYDMVNVSTGKTVESFLPRGERRWRDVRETRFETIMFLSTSISRVIFSRARKRQRATFRVATMCTRRDSSGVSIGLNLLMWFFLIRHSFLKESAEENSSAFFRAAETESMKNVEKNLGIRSTKFCRNSVAMAATRCWFSAVKN